MNILYMYTIQNVSPVNLQLADYRATVLLMEYGTRAMLCYLCELYAQVS